MHVTTRLVPHSNQLCAADFSLNLHIVYSYIGPPPIFSCLNWNLTKCLFVYAGVGRMVAESAEVPLVLPLWHVGKYSAMYVYD